MREAEFIAQLRSLLGAPVSGLSESEKLGIIQRLTTVAGTGAGGSALPGAEWVPFVTGRRPIDEAAYPRLGSSDHVGLILEDDSPNFMYLLFRLENFDAIAVEDLESYEVRVTLSFAGPWGNETHPPIEGWNRRSVELLSFEPDLTGAPRIAPASVTQHAIRSFVIPISVRETFLPKDDSPNDPFTFEHLFVQQVRAELTLLRSGVPVSSNELMVDVCDARRFGSLYKRVVERVIKPDTQAQARRAGLGYLDHAYHPWFPVLLIGGDKADLYTRALIEDIVHKQRHLTDPRWLLRVGLYLEFLTCIGIFESVRDELGDLLGAEEREAYEKSETFAPLRDAVNVQAWQAVWKLRPISLQQAGASRNGQVTTLNLLNKKKATLAFLETHHEDLQRAIEFAGPNDHNAQETWHRVFRDAERAVLRKTPLAFPELDAIGPKARDFVLWHRKGRIRGISIPQGLSGWFGDQDGLYASACNQYRASMNHVSSWARRQGLMDFTGDECIPDAVSLLTSFMESKHVRLGQLQRRDGYAGTLDITADVPRSIEVNGDRALELLRAVPIFRVFADDEVRALAHSIRPIELGPVERIIVQGRKGSSLFILAEGTLEVLIRQKDGVDLPIATLEAGAVFGEMSLLTGAPRSATVRSTDPAVIYEIGHHQLAPILQSRPEAIDQLAALMEPRLSASRAAAAKHSKRRQSASLASRIRTFMSASQSMAEGQLAEG